MRGCADQFGVKVQISAAKREAKRPRALLRAVVALVAADREREGGEWYVMKR